MKNNKKIEKLCASFIAAILAFEPCYAVNYQVPEYMEYKNVQVLDNITVENDNENDNENADNNGPFTALGYIEPEHKAQSAIQDGISSITEDSEFLTSVSIPASYDSRDKGYVTAIRNQKDIGSCWAFAATASIESYILSHGLASSASEVDLSEYALAYMTMNDTTYEDPMGGTTGDYTTPSNINHAVSGGGNQAMAFKTLSKGSGYGKWSSCYQLL